MFRKISYKLKTKFYRGTNDFDINMEELKIKREKGAIIMDVRNKREYNEAHIFGSINVPEYEINESIFSLIKNKKAEIVVYCSSGYRSLKAYKRLKKLGYENIYNLYGGIEKY